MLEDGPHPVDSHVGRRVSEKRIGLGYTQADLARALGLTFQQIQKYEKGANRISASKLWDIATFFQTDVSYFYRGLEGGYGHGGTAGGQIEELAQTRTSLEIGRLAKQLSSAQQKLALNLMAAMADRQADPD